MQIWNLFTDCVLHLQIMRSLFADFKSICRSCFVFTNCNMHFWLIVSSFSMIMALFCHNSETIVSEFWKQMWHNLQTEHDLHLQTSHFKFIQILVFKYKSLVSICESGCVYLWMFNLFVDHALYLWITKSLFEDFVSICRSCFTFADHEDFVCGFLIYL